MTGLAEVRAIEAACLSGWPVLKSAWDGSWQLRWARGLTKRGNSIHCLDPEDGDRAATRLAAMADIYRRLGQAPVLRVTPLTASTLVTAAEERGWTVTDRSDVLSAELTGMTMPEGDIRLLSPLDPAWIRAQQKLQFYDEPTTDALRAIAEMIVVPARGVVMYSPQGEAVATALAVNSFGLAGFFNVVVAADGRGQGHGRKLMQAALAWAYADGARHAAIQTLEHNLVAQNLYRSLGFARSYGYSYRRAPGGAA